MVPLEHKLLLFHIGLTEPVNSIFVIYVFGDSYYYFVISYSTIFFLILKMLQSIFSLKLLPKILAPFLCLPDTLKLSSCKKWASSSFTRFVIICQNYMQYVLWIQTFKIHNIITYRALWSTTLVSCEVGTYFVILFVVWGNQEFKKKHNDRIENLLLLLFFEGG